MLNNGFEVIANGPDGLRQRIADEVPKWRDIMPRPASSRCDGNVIASVSEAIHIPQFPSSVSLAGIAQR